MAGYLTRARGLVQSLFGGPAAPAPPSGAAAEPAGDNLVVVAGSLRFVDSARAADPRSWLEAFTAASVRNVRVDPQALAIIEHRLNQDSKAPLPPEHVRAWLLEFLQPRPGLSRSLTEMRSCGLLGRLLPEVSAAVTSKNAQQPFTSIEALEGLLIEKTLSADRFGTMLGELGESQLLVLTILLRDPAVSGQNVGESVRVARAAMDRLGLSTDRQQAVEFLIRNQFQMAQTAFRRDTSDPDVIRRFAALFSTEDQLKMLCLMTVADASAAGSAGLTPWKAELLWRLFVDAYNQLTMAYGDDIIDQSEAAIATLHANRPPTLSGAELAKFLEGLPRRYLTLFDPESIYEHVKLCRDLGPDDLHISLKKKAGLWELTVAATDKPYLFSNVCGVLSYLDLDILRGHAFTSLTSVVIDVFQFTERVGALEESRLKSLLSDVIGGRRDVTDLVREKERTMAPTHAEGSTPVIYFDNDSSQRYTILELLAGDSPGLLYRISRALSSYGCSVELVLIATEGHKAVDVFHLKKGEGKLNDSDQLALTEELERALRNV